MFDNATLGLMQQCDINVRSDRRDLAMSWIVRWGVFGEQEQFDGFDIICMNTTR